MRGYLLVGLFGMAVSAMAVAQDTRTVTEPKIPALCAKLDAQLTSVKGGLAAADESKLDTERIQKAIDACGKGMGVMLQAHGGANAFLSGPLELREGVTLVVDKGVTLYETIDAKVMENSPGSYGVVNETPGRGCK